MIRRDKQATMDKQFLDPDSYVTPDGREILKGEDWKARVEDLLRRSGGRCEQVSQVGTGILAAPLFERCSAGAADPHHVVRRSIKRDDRLANLQALCRFHHDLLDKRKVRWTKHSDVAVR